MRRTTINLMGSFPRFEKRGIFQNSEANIGEQMRAAEVCFIPKARPWGITDK
jgi:hypothetical protein